ncbi:MAG: MBL fold metallo-hydrolase, partial [Sphingomonadales bacterium]
MTIDIEAIFDDGTNTITYIVSEPDSKAAAIIDSVLDFDPASGGTSTASAEKVVRFVEERGLNPRYILETHVHADHLTASQFLKQTFGAKTGISEKICLVQETFGGAFNAGAEFKCDGSQFDMLLSEGQKLPLGAEEITVLLTPGHTPACATFVVGGAAFTGDTIFMPYMGTSRCDFPAGDARALFASIRKILALPPQTRLFVGHDYGTGGREIAWETTVAEELKMNIHVKEGTSEDAFVEMRQTRDAELAVPKLLLSAVQVNMRAGAMPPAEDNGVSYLKLPINQF